MKPEELMIGDWVIHQDFGALRVGIINNYNNTIFDDDNMSGYMLSIQELQSIPLTVKILKKNGFYVYDRDDYSDAKLDINVDEDNLYQISINRKGSNYHIAIHYIKCFDHKTGKYDSHCLYSNGLFSEFKPLYVHELQHAFRLCGLNELANNFKI